MKISIENKPCEVKGQNLYKFGPTYYRLFAHSVSPNGCWLINPVMQELIDIDTATGKDVYGGTKIILDSCGTVPGSFDFITTEHVPDFVKAFEEKHPPKRSGWRSIPGIPVELI